VGELKLASRGQSCAAWGSWRGMGLMGRMGLMGLMRGMGQMGLMRGMADGGAPHRCFDCCRCFYGAQWGIM